MTNDTLNMYNPEGDLVRTFEDKIHSLHHGLGGLLIGIRRPWQNPPMNYGQENSCDTLVTDGVMNVVDTLPGVDVLQAFPSGLVGRRGGDFFIAIGNRSFPCDASSITNGSLLVAEHCAISVRGLVDKTLYYFDVNNPDFVVLKTYKASPMTIPYVQVTAGPKNLFSVSVALGDFVKIYVYDRKTILIETTVTIHHDWYSRTHCFTHDFFVVFQDSVLSSAVSCTVYPLGDFRAGWSTLVESSLDVIISPQPCSYLRNSFVASDLPNQSKSTIVSTPDALFEELYIYIIDDVRQTITRKGNVDMMRSHPLKSSLGCYCNYLYAIEKKNVVSDIHLVHFRV